MDYQTKLRAFADYLDERPALAEKLASRYNYPSEYIYAEDWEEFKALCKDLGGFDKSGYGGSLEAVHRERLSNNDDLSEDLFYIRVGVSGVCTITPKVDEDGNPVMRPKRVYMDTGEMEQEMEYSCPDVWTQ